MQNEVTIFDKIIAKTIPAKIVFENEDVLAFEDVNPQAPIHVLVIPKKKIRSFDELGLFSAEQTGKLFQGVYKTVQKLSLPKGYRLVVNCGQDGGQSVDYLHVHILGKRSLDWPPG
jgi:histidine triad (HIT) family protein